MSELWQWITDPEADFVRSAFLLGLLASIAFGGVGSIVVVRRLGYLAGAIAHASLGGVGAALYLDRVLGWTWVHPILGAMVASLCAGALMAAIRRFAPEREDTLIGAIWAVGMSAGFLLLSLVPGYADPMAYLVGDILLVSERDLFWGCLLDVTLIALLVIFYRRLQAVCFDEEFAELRGLRVEAYYLLILLTISLTVVLLLAVVGLVLVVALLTLPAATAGRLTRSLGGMMLGGVLIALVSVWGGMSASFVLDWPTGPVIALLAAALYLLTSLGVAIRR